MLLNYDKEKNKGSLFFKSGEVAVYSFADDELLLIPGKRRANVQISIRIVFLQYRVLNDTQGYRVKPRRYPETTLSFSFPLMT